MRPLTSLLTIAACAVLAGCPPTDPRDMGMMDAGADAQADATVFDAGPDDGLDAGPDAALCDEPPDAAPPNPLPPHGYAGCFRDRFQVEAPVGDIINVGAALTASLNADLGGAIPLAWWSGAPPAAVVVAPVVDPNRFLQVEFRDIDGALTPVDFEWQCAVVERIQFQVEAARPGLASAINVGRACPVVALGAIDEPSFEMQAWHLQSMGLNAEPGLPPLVPRGPTPGVNGGVDVVLIDSGIDPTLIGPLGISILPSVVDEPLGVSRTSDRLSPHGSAMALLIRQLAPDARLHSVRILGPDNIGSIPDLARALDAAHTLAGGICGGERVPAGTCQACPEAEQDADGDGWCDEVDNCPERANPFQTDGDGDGRGDVCDDYACIPTIGAPDDICNGVDDDCDGQVDEAPEQICPGNANGCARVAVCVDGLTECLDENASKLEVCDDVPQECEVNEPPHQVLCSPEGDWCQAGLSECEGDVETCTLDPQYSCENDENCNRDDIGQACDTGQAGNCAAGRVLCNDGPRCVQAWQPTGIDRCGDGDSDCDGQVDEDAVVGPCVTDQPGACRVGHWECTDEGSACVATPAEEVCNGIDDNCDGQVDEGLDCTTCCDNQGTHAVLALAACAVQNRRDDWICEPKCCDDGVRRLAGNCDFFVDDESICDVCCVDGQLTPVPDDNPMIVNLSLGWPPELSMPRTLTGTAGPATMGNECVVEEGPVGESVRWALERMARRDRNVAPTAVFSASGNRPGRARDNNSGTQVNNLAKRYRDLFKVTGVATDPCRGAHPLPMAPFWFMPAGFGRAASCPFGRELPQYLTFGVGGISDTDLPTVQSIDAAEPPLVGPGQHVYVDHPALRRRAPYVCDDQVSEQDGLEGPFPFTGTSVPTALATGAAARAFGLLPGIDPDRRTQARLLYYTGRPVDDGRPNTPRIAASNGMPVHRMDACRMEFALTDPRCADFLDNCVSAAGSDAGPLLPACTAMQTACLANADAPNGPCTERPRVAVPLNPDYTPDPGCQEAVLCTSDWKDAAMTCEGNACPFETAPDRHSMGTLSGTPVVTGCPDCYLDAVKARFEVVVNNPLNVVSATLIYDEAPNNYGIKYLSLPATQWYKGDSFHIAGLSAFSVVCPSFAKLDLVHKDPQTGQYISDTSAIRVDCK